MRYLLLLSHLTILFFSASAQTTTEYIPTDTDHKNDSTIVVLSYCEVMPVLKTNEYKSFEDYISKNLIYPEVAKLMRQSGTCYIEFIIEIDGSVSNVRIVRGRELYPSLDKEGIRVVSNSPKWNPGMQNGKAVRVKKITKISFNFK